MARRLYQRNGIWCILYFHGGKHIRKARRKNARNPHLVTAAIKDVRSAWTAALEKAGLDPGLHLHDLRRTFRTHMKMAGVDSFTLNEIMGHANPKIEKVYTQLDDDHLVRAIAHIPDWNSHKTSTSDSGQEKRATLWNHVTL